jgi:hypothetical protein
MTTVCSQEVSTDALALGADDAGDGFDWEALTCSDDGNAGAGDSPRTEARSDGVGTLPTQGEVVHRVVQRGGFEDNVHNTKACHSAECPWAKSDGRESGSGGDGTVRTIQDSRSTGEIPPRSSENWEANVHEEVEPGYVVKGGTCGNLNGMPWNASRPAPPLHTDGVSSRFRSPRSMDLILPVCVPSSLEDSWSAFE